MGEKIKMNNVNVLRNTKIEINLEKCTKCGACIAECPLRLYYFREDVLFIRRSSEMLCMECGHCVAVCPVNVINLQRFPTEEIKILSKDDKVPTYNELVDLIKIRRSVRQFKKEPVSDDLWKKLIEAGRFAPTGHNDQLIHFTVVRDRALLDKISEEITKNFVNLAEIYKNPSRRDEFKSLVPKKYLKIAKIALIGLKDMLKGIARGEEFWRWNGELLILHAPKKTTSLEQDCSLAAGNIMLAATILGLGTCSLGLMTAALTIFDSVANLINLPKKHVVGYALAVGIPKVKYYRTPPRQTAKVSWF